MSVGTPNRRALIEWFVREISKVQQERAERPGVTEAGELEWVVFERDKLLGLINWELAKIGKPQVEMPKVMQIEQSAVGHVDYTQKLAIRAAELVLAG
jgi:hypothetical protein